MMMITKSPRPLRNPSPNRQAQWVPGEDVPSEELLDSTLGSPGQADELGDGIEQVDQRRLRNLVHARVFGEAPDTLEIGRYLVLERLGSGGMGVVFSAYDRELDRKIAIKLLHQSKHDSHARLLREAQALARLSHPNVIQVHDVGETGGQVFVAMEFVAGKTLREWIRERPRSIREIVDAYVQAGRGLEAAHKAGIVHRDFKPDNVLIGDDGRVRVLDFGIARAERDESGEGERPDPKLDPTLPLTRTGAIVGTPAYMAPEQHLGRPADMRSDQFAFCVALHESLYRTRPFAGDSYAELIDNVTAGRKRPLDGSTNAPRWLRELLARGLAADPAQRFPSMTVLLRELSRDRVVTRARLAIAATTVVLAGAVVYSVVERERAHEVEAASLAGEIASESQRADDAEHELRRREDAVTIAEASQMVADSPVDALAKLRELHDDHTLAGAPWIIASDARQRGLPSSIGHWPEPLTVVRVSGDGRRALLIDAKTHLLHVFDVLTGQTSATRLVVEEGPMKISKHGRLVAVRANDDPTAIEVWDVDAGSSTRLATPLAGSIDDLHIAPDGDRLVVSTSGEGKQAWLLDRAGGSWALPEGMNVMTFVPASEDLLLIDREGVLRRFTPDTGALKTILREVGFAVEISPNGKYVAAVTRDWRNHRVLIATLDGPETREPVSFAFEDSTIFHIAWHPNSDALAVGGSEGNACVIGLDAERRTDLPFHHRQLRSFAFSPDGLLVASASQGGDVFLTRLSDGHIQRQPGHRSMGWVVFDDEGKLRTVDWEGTLRVWDPAPRQLVLPGSEITPHHLAWSRQGLLGVASPYQLVVVSTADAEVLWKTEEHAPYEGLAWSGTGERLASVHGDGGLRVWSAAGALEQTVKTEGGEAGQVRWLGERIAWGEGGVGVHLLDPDSGNRELIPIPSASKIVALAPDPEHQQLWVGIRSGTNMGSVLAFDEQTWERTAEHQLGRDGLMDIALIPGRNELVYGTFFGDVFILEVETGERRRFGVHDDQVHTVEIDALGRTLYTASHDGAARVWDLASGRFRELRADGQRVWSLARSPDGTRVATGQSFGRVVIWRDDLPYEWNDLRAWIDEVSPPG